jgi:dienelactone hydrolase
MRLSLAVGIGVWSAIWLATTSACAQDIVDIEASQPDASRRVLLRAELHRPRGEGSFPAVILMHGCSGWVPAVHHTLHDYADELRRRGYVALNLDSFGPRHYSGDEMCASNTRLREALDYRTADAFDALRYLATLPYVDARNVFLIGQSNGGSVAMRTAQASATKTYDKSGSPGFRGVVAYYPWCGVFAGGVRLAAPIQVFSGERDEWVSARECAAVRTSGADYRIKLYPRAVHSFDLEIAVQRFAGFPIGRDPEAAEDSRKRMFNFFRDHLTEDQKSARQFTD